MGLILHATSRVAWEEARTVGTYTAPSLADEGFIHCSTPEQMTRVAESMLRGQTGLVLLCIDESRVAADVRYEGYREDGPRFPHVYGPLNLDAIVEIIDFPARSDGTFELPAEVDGVEARLRSFQ
jgi:uncharacterized protein (DUF952 family)